MQLLPVPGKKYCKGVVHCDWIQLQIVITFLQMFLHTIKLCLYKQKTMAHMKQLWLFDFWFHLSEETYNYIKTILQ